MKMAVAEAIVRYLERKGVDMVFGVPGAAILPFYDALITSSIRSYVVRHEQTGAFAADGYSRVTGRVGVCASTSGPGATNLVTGLYGAWFDSIPMIALTGQVASASIGTAAFQEAPTTAIATPVTKKSFLLKKAEDAPAVIHEAYRVATTGRRGPVLLDLPVDVQRTVIDVDLDELQDVPEVLPVPSADEVRRAADMLIASARPVIIAGGGVILAEATAELRELAELTAIPVVNSYMGKGSFPADHALWAGMMGTMCNTPLGNKVLMESDLMINLGGRFGDRSTGRVDVFKHGANVIHVNLDPAELGKSVPTELGIACDVKAFLQMLCQELRDRGYRKDYLSDQRVLRLQAERSDYSRRTDFDSVPIKPQRAIAELRRFLDRDAVVTHDCGISQIWSAQLFDAYEPRSYLVTGGAGTMGWGLGAAIGAKLAFPNRQVVNLLGDGSIGMSLQDIATAAKFNVPIVIYVLNNSLLGLIRQQQNWFYGRRHISTDLDYESANDGRGIDFVRAAEAMGAIGERVETPDQIRPALERAFAAGRPALIEVVVDPAAVCSMADDGTITGVKEAV